MAESEPVHTGKTEGFDELFTRLHEEIERRARSKVHDEKARSIETQDLVNEVYLRLREYRSEIDLENEKSFRGLVTTVIRRTLIDRAKARVAEKRGGGRGRVNLDKMLEMMADEAEPSEVLLVDTALEKLAEELPENARLIEQKYFGGFTVEMIAEDLGVTRHKIDRKLTAGMASLKDIILQDLEG